MLLSPAQIHSRLSSVTSPSDRSLPHTAMLITPAGQIMSWVSTPPGYDYYEQEEGDGEEPNGQTDNGAEDEEEVEEEEEPWLDTPERLRLILGLVAEFTEGTINKIESELGKLLVAPLSTDWADSVPGSITPAVRPPASSSFLLILNGTGKSDWSTLTTKANEFKDAWLATR